jgi:two-component system, chemotaxis family, chemotaxis protein CheY
MWRILVVDDDKSIRELVTEWLRDEGFDVTTAANGAEALEEVQTQRPDVIVLDLMMPVMDGWAFAEACHQLTNPRPIPIVVVSATHELVDAAERLRSFGVRVSMPKPFNLDVLAATVARLAEHREPVPWPG